MSLTVEIVGLDKMLSTVDPSRFDHAVQRILDRGIQSWRDNTKKMPAVSAKTTGYGEHGIPVDSGRLRQSIQSRRLSAVAAGVYSPVRYASSVHEGTSRMPPRPFFQWSFEMGTQQDIERIVTEEFSRLVA
jgi:hypothetical protein